MSEKPLRAVLYERVSDAKDRETKRQLNVRSVSEQDHELREVAVREGWDIVAVFVDNDRSASRYSKKSRGDFADMVKFLEAGNADLVGAWEASRYQRDLAVYLQLRDICHRNNVLYHYSGRTYDLSRTDDRFTTGLDALLAERESDVTRDRILRGVRARAQSGHPHGKLPYGYVREYDPQTKAFLRQIEEPEQAAIYREAAKRALSGETRYAICRDFDDRGIDSPRPGQGWTVTTLTRLLINPTYIGKRTLNGLVVGDAVWDGLISVADHRRLREMFSKHEHQGSSAPREASIRHLLSGIVTCGVPDCGGRMVVLMNRGNPTYTCATRWHLGRIEHKVDEYVCKTIVAWLSRPEAAADIASRDDDPQAQAAREEAATLEARLEAFYDEAGNGALSPKALARLEQKLMPQIEAANARARAASPLPTTVHQLAGNPDAGRVWAQLDIHQKRAVIKALFQIVILPAGKGQRTFDPRLIRITPKFGSAD